MAAASERVRGNKGIVATFKIGQTAAKAFDNDLKKMELTSEDRDSSDVTFAEAAEGVLKDFTLEVTAIQSTDAASFWRYLWDNPGAEIAVVYGPHGNAAASAAKPHFAFTVKNTGKPTFGGESTTDETGYEFEHELKVTSSIELVTN